MSSQWATVVLAFRKSVRAALCALLLAACGSQEAARTTAKAGPPVSGMELKGELAYRTPLEHADALGISGSCRGEDAVWLIAERNARLLRVDDDGRVRSIPIEGVPEDVDLEGLACKDGRFYVSTETEKAKRSGDIVLVVDLVDSTARVSKVLTMHYPPGMMASSNQGLEGLCIAGDWLIAAGEILRSDGTGVRQAPILRQRLGDGNTFLHWVELTSSTGKLSGIDCRMRNDVIEVFAIERHYEVCRVLHFELGDDTSKSETVLELAHLIRDTENFESILVDERGQVRLSNDNQYKTITGPSEETFLVPVHAFSR